MTLQRATPRTTVKLRVSKDLRVVYLDCVLAIEGGTKDANPDHHDLKEHYDPDGYGDGLKYGMEGGVYPSAPTGVRINGHCMAPGVGARRGGAFCATTTGSPQEGAATVGVHLEVRGRSGYGPEMRSQATLDVGCWLGRRCHLLGLEG